MSHGVETKGPEAGAFARLAETGHERLDAAGRAAAERAEDAGTVLREAARDLHHRLARLEARMEHEVHRNPLPFIGAALALLALGIGLGTAAVRRRS